MILNKIIIFASDVIPEITDKGYEYINSVTSGNLEKGVLVEWLQNELVTFNKWWIGSVFNFIDPFAKIIASTFISACIVINFYHGESKTDDPTKHPYIGKAVKYFLEFLGYTALSSYIELWVNS